MKNSSLPSPVILFLFILAAGCSLTQTAENVSDDRFANVVGPFNRDYVRKESKTGYFNLDNKDEQYLTTYSSYSDATDKITYRISTHEDEKRARNEQESIARRGDTKCFSPVSLTDRSGKDVGTLTTCRKEKFGEAESGGTLVGAEYSIAFNVGNTTHSAYVENAFGKFDPALTDKLVNFVQALPAAAELDLRFLDALKSGMAHRLITKEKLIALSPPAKIASKPYLKGKTAVARTGDIFQGVATDFYIDAVNRAALMDEAGSAVKIECAKGEKLGDYVVKETGARMPAYAAECKVTVIDLSLPAVIATRTFKNTMLGDKASVRVDKDGKLADSNSEYVPTFPTYEIKEYLAGLPVRD